METIIGLLIVLVPVLFKVIGKKLEQAGQDGRVMPVSRPQGEDAADVKVRMKEAVADAPVIMPEKKDVVGNVAENVTRQTPVRKPVQKVNDEPVKSKEKIDPKKLVVYSEIMKPKYTE